MNLMEIINPYYDIYHWPVTNESIDDYSKINYANRITGCKKEDEAVFDIKYYEKLLLLNFNLVYDSSELGERYISNRLFILRTTKNGAIANVNTLSHSINLHSMTDTRGKRSYTSYSDNGSFDSLRVMYDSNIKSKFTTCIKYTVRLHEDELLNDITKIQKYVPSLFQLCFYSINTNNLPQYNHINRTMNLSMKMLHM